jgi:hypothetical protein
VNETDVKDLFASAVAHPDVDRIDTDAVLRGGRRRRRIRTAAVIGSVLAVLALVGSVAFVSRPRPTPPVVADRSTLTVTCSPDGIVLSGEVVEATSAGVVITMSSTMPPGSALNYRWPARDSALTTDAYRPMTTTPQTWTMTAPPGPLTLSCAGLRHAVPFGGAHTVTVSDPHRYWSSATAAELGCRAGFQLMPAVPPGTGPTPEAAVDDYLRRNWHSALGPDISTAQLPIGYPDAVSQVWLVSRQGVPATTLTVDRTETTYEAHHNTNCALPAPSASTSG